MRDGEEVEREGGSEGTAGISAEVSLMIVFGSEIDGFIAEDCEASDVLWAMEVWNVSSRLFSATWCCCRASTLSDALLAEAVSVRNGGFDIRPSVVDL